MTLKRFQLNRYWLRRHRKGLARLRYILFALFVPILLGIANLSNPITGDLVVNAASGESVLNFYSDITINTDGSLLVTEEIKVRAEGESIERGIYRDLSLTSPFRSGIVPYEILDVRRNGETTPYEVERVDGNKRIKIYQEDVYLDPGIYTFEIDYRTDRQLDRSRNRDRLYWNVTGQNWEFPIENAGAIVRLPDEIPTDRVNLKAFTGSEGEKGQSYEDSFDDSGNALFSTTRPLNVREGLTIIVEFPKGYVAQPSLGDRIAGVGSSIIARPLVSIPLILVVVIAIAFIVARVRRGRETAKSSL
jgi:hypothetical protein